MTQRFDYTVAQKVIHWLMGLLIMLDLVVARKFGDEMELWDRLESRSDHATVGTIITALFVARIVLRLRHGAAALPPGMSDWQIRLARLTHGAFYFFLGLLILSGIATGMAATSPIEPFRAFDLTLGLTEEDMFSNIRVVHDFATWAVVGLIGLHIVAALWHWLVLRDGVLGRMLRFWRSESGTAPTHNTPATQSSGDAT